jgi:hypothetical protein
MRKDDLMKPDLLCKVLLFGSALTIGTVLVIVVAAMMRGAAL